MEAERRPAQSHHLGPQAAHSRGAGINTRTDQPKWSQLALEVRELWGSQETILLQIRGVDTG